MPAQTSMLHIRVDDDIKEQATAALTTMGLSVSDAVRLFLRRVVVDQAFPLELKAPAAALPGSGLRAAGVRSCNHAFLDQSRSPSQKLRLCRLQGLKT
jgi:addiction module RelB/DinJ family antitoxin